MKITNMTRIIMIQAITSRLGDTKARAGIWQLQKGQVAYEYVMSQRRQVNEDVPKNFRASNESLPQFKQSGIPLDWPHLGHLPFIGESCHLACHALKIPTLHQTTASPKTPM